MEESDKITWLVELLDFRNLPKSVKKQALFEICRYLNLKFSKDDLEDIERKFAAMSANYDGTLACPFCLGRFPQERAVRKTSSGTHGRLSYSSHLENCTVLRGLISKHFRVIVKMRSNGTVRRSRGS